MRLFVALQLSEEMKDALCAAQDALYDCSRGGNFSRRENLHMTLAFLGECPPSSVSRIRRAMEQTGQSAQPFSLTLGRMGRFRRGGSDLWWAGVQRQPALEKLALDLQNALRSEGFALEERSFAAHLTLARQVDAPNLRPEEIPLAKCTQKVAQMSLMESTRVGGVLTYREIFSVKLG